ncbi:MAG: zinc ribbon domain-containing protein [Coriobacteriia bacterium]|nr:zinc ribbon domain-containing protein [Coriobacteriia bacterium]
MDAALQAKLAPIAAALGALGYSDDIVWDAALRMSWVPDLASDLQAYAAAGAAAGPNHPSAMRPLNEGYTVSYLMTGYGFSPTEAFLMGAALITHTSEALTMLQEIYHHGRSMRRADGSYRIVYPPAAVQAAPAPTSDPAFRDEETIELLDIPAEGAPVSPATTASVAFCTACGKPLTAGAAFCESCGAKAE